MPTEEQDLASRFMDGGNFVLKDDDSKSMAMRSQTPTKEQKHVIDYSFQTEQKLQD